MIDRIQGSRHCIRLLFSITTALVAFSPQTRVYGIAGLEGTFEFGLDAPWRMEPNKKPDGSNEYGAIPIQITIHDARHANMDNVMYPAGPEHGGVIVPDQVVSLGQFYSVRIHELTATETNSVEFPLSALHEVECILDDWPIPPSEFGILPEHRLRRIWRGEDAEDCRDVSQTSEWHATLFYVPREQSGGKVVSLKVEVLLQRGSWPPPPIETTYWENNRPIFKKVSFDFSPFLTLRSYVRVYLAPDPLPRFDNRWLYGDLHYHSQGTDNEGEAAYNYRGVIRAMGAMGLDFLFATDHASSSSQIVDADLPPVNKIPEIAHSHDDRLLESDVKFTTGILRDMNEERFAFCHDLIYGDRGVNNEASWRAGNFQFPQNYRSYGILPQIFLGGEVDAVPELSVSTVQANTVAGSDGKFKVSIPYGNGLRFDLGTLCTPQGCDDPRNLLDQVDGDTYLVRDFQGISSFEYFGREHMVYFPNSSNRIVGAETTFIPSYTSRFGGATRRLDSASVPSGNPIPPLLPEIERKGVAFVAHHLNASGGANGPGGPPWTDAMLLKAFRSPAVLGLEFWNENSRNRTPVCSHDFCANDNRFGGYEEGYQREETLKADSNNPLEAFVANVEYLFGFDPLPDKFHNIALPLEEVRRGFITGDSNGGLFELSVFDPLTGRWQEELHEIEHALHHGAYDWDMLNLRGLDFEKNQELPWLAPGEPRRMFMAGGSDAHGDLNYRRAGYFLGTDDANDAALGKPRNLVFVGNPLGSVVYSHGPVAEDPTRSGGADKRTGLSIRSAAAPTDGDEPTSVDPAPDSPVVQPDDPLNDPPMDGEPAADRPYVPPFSKIPVDDIRANLNGLEIRAHSQEQVVTALRRGQFCVTDGPIIRVAIDLNGNNQIDDSDLQMGGVHRLTYDDALNGLPSRSDTVTLLTEVVSTREFGPIMDIDVYVGAHPSPNHVNPSEPVEPRIYAPYFHGPGGFKDDAEHSPTTLYDSNGRTYYRQKDNYWRGESAGDNVTWNYTSGEPFSYTYTLVTTLHLNNYEVGKGVPADRFFVRAYAQTAPIDNPEPVSSRYAYSNPIWIIRQPSLIGLSHIAERGLKSPSSSANDALAPTLRAVRNAKGELVLHFTGTCMFSPRLGEPFKDIPGAVSPYVVPAEQRAGFFRVRR